jgi:hypothetical protein
MFLTHNLARIKSIRAIRLIFCLLIFSFLNIKILSAQLYVFELRGLDGTLIFKELVDPEKNDGIHNSEFFGTLIFQKMGILQNGLGFNLFYPLGQTQSSSALNPTLMSSYFIQLPGSVPYTNAITNFTIGQNRAKKTLLSSFHFPVKSLFNVSVISEKDGQVTLNKFVESNFEEGTVIRIHPFNDSDYPYIKSIWGDKENGDDFKLENLATLPPVLFNEYFKKLAVDPQFKTPGDIFDKFQIYDGFDTLYMAAKMFTTFRDYRFDISDLKASTSTVPQHLKDKFIGKYKHLVTYGQYYEKVLNITLPEIQKMISEVANILEKKSEGAEISQEDKNYLQNAAAFVARTTVVARHTGWGYVYGTHVITNSPEYFELDNPDLKFKDQDEFTSAVQCLPRQNINHETELDFMMSQRKVMEQMKRKYLKEKFEQEYMMEIMAKQKKIQEQNANIEVIQVSGAQNRCWMRSSYYHIAERFQSNPQGFINAVGRIFGFNGNLSAFLATKNSSEQMTSEDGATTDPLSVFSESPEILTMLNQVRLNPSFLMNSMESNHGMYDSNTEAALLAITLRIYNNGINNTNLQPSDHQLRSHWINLINSNNMGDHFMISELNSAFFPDMGLMPVVMQSYDFTPTSSQSLPTPEVQLQDIYTNLQSLGIQPGQSVPYYNGFNHYNVVRSKEK